MKFLVLSLLFALLTVVLADVGVHATPQKNHTEKRFTKISKRAAKKKPHIYSADATVYDAGLGACGITNSGEDYIVALGAGHFDKGQPAGDTNPNHNHYCGKKIKATLNGVTIKAVIQDKCPGCAANDLDFARSPFAELTRGQNTGRFKVKWHFA